MYNKDMGSKNTNKEIKKVIDKHNTMARFNGKAVVLGTKSASGSWVRWFGSRSWFFCKYSELTEV